MPWWYRRCDLALIFGTFFYGLGKYEAMLNDKEPPFGRGISQFIISDSSSAQALRYSRVTTRAAIKLFDDTLSVDNCNSQAESREVSAAAVAASKLVSDRGSIIEQGSTSKDSKMNPTCNTDKPQSFQTPNALENLSQNLK